VFTVTLLLATIAASNRGSLHVLPRQSPEQEDRGHQCLRVGVDLGEAAVTQQASLHKQDRLLEWRVYSLTTLADRNTRSGCAENGAIDRDGHRRGTIAHPVCPVRAPRHCQNPEIGLSQFSRPDPDHCVLSCRPRWPLEPVRILDQDA